MMQKMQHQDSEEGIREAFRVTLFYTTRLQKFITYNLLEISIAIDTVLLFIENRIYGDNV